MANLYERALLNLIWGEDALPADIGDPDIFKPSEPVYPGDVPNMYEKGWFVSGDEVVKQPHQWINYFYRGVDLGIVAHAAQYNRWSELVDYKKEAVVFYDQNFYKALIPSPTSTPSLVSTEWEVCFTTLEEFKTLIDIVIASTDGHLALRNNPHNLTATQINAYTIPQLDSTLSNALDNINTHKDTANPHNETPYQVGTIPDSGGVFTGEVRFRSLLIPFGVVRIFGNALRIEASEGRFGLTDNLMKDSKLVLSENNFEPLKQKNNYRFKVRCPDIAMPLLGDLNMHSNVLVESCTYQGEAMSFTNYRDEVVSVGINEVPFNLGLHIDPSKSQSLSIEGTINTDVSIMADVDGERKFVYLPLWTNGNLIEILGATNLIKNIHLWMGEIDSFGLSTFNE